ncbi:MAG: AsmA-like C-terminal domain-containing protein, partial [Campylobacter hyointestinalis]
TKKTINLTNLANLKKSSQIMQELGIEDANLSLKTDDFSKFNINLTGTKFDMSLQKRDGTPYKEDDFSINLNKDINITSKSELMKFDISGNLIKAYFKDLILVVDKNMSNQNEQKDIKFFATNSALYLKDSNRTISFDKFSGSITKNELVFDGNNSFDSNIRVIKKNGDLKIFGQNLSSGFANDFLGLNSFNEGNFTIKLHGKDFDTFQSEIKVKNTYLSSYKFYQKFLSFINSVPSLLIFKVPDFNDKGFTVNDGVMFIERDNNKLNIKALNLTGSSADIAGRGSIDLDSKDVNIDFELKLLKDASSIISKIPLVGHIFLGDDKTISTVIEVRGTLDEPKFETQIIKDIIKTPYNIIKNTLQLPFTIFD